MRAGDVLEHPLQHKAHPEEQTAPLLGGLEQVGKVDFLRAYYSERNKGKLTYWDGHGRRGLDPNEQWNVAIYDLNDAEADLMLFTFDPITMLAKVEIEKARELQALLNPSSDSLKDLCEALSAKYRNQHESAAALLGKETERKSKKGNDDGEEFTEDIEIKLTECPKCHHRFPK